MMQLETVPVRDWIALAIGLIGLVTAQIQSQNRLPRWARNWLSKLGPERVERAIAYAAKLNNLSPEARRNEAVEHLLRLSEHELGFTVPRSIANLLVEFVYQQWKRRR